MIASGFTWWHLLPGVWNDTLLSPLGVSKGTHSIFAAFAVMFLIIVFAVIGRLSLERAKRRSGLDRYYADDRFTMRNFVEMLVEGIQSIMGNALHGKDVRTFFPLIGALFTCILFSNLFGLLPGFLPPTENLSNNAAMALTVFVVFNAVGLLKDPLGYIKHLMGPVLPLAILIFPLEVIGLLVRPVSLSVRLTGNMYGDHTVYQVMTTVVPVVKFFPLVWPAVFLALGLLVCVIQAFVFSLLSSVYIALSLPHHEEEHGGEHAH